MLQGKKTVDIKVYCKKIIGKTLLITVSDIQQRHLQMVW